MIHKLNKLINQKVLVCIFIFFISHQLTYAQYLTGDNTPAPNSMSSYTFYNGSVYVISNWLISGGTLVSSSKIGNEYEATVQWGSAGYGSVKFRNKYTVIETLNVTIGSPGPAVPDMPTITNNCNSTRLTRGTPPSGEVWYWQNSSSGTSTSNSAVYVDTTSGTLYYLKSYKSSISQWSAARIINYTVTQDACGLSNENYIHSVTPNIETSNISTLANDQKVESVTYFDGLGRPMQSIGIRAGGNSEDIITHINYDNYGRSDKDYLPYARLSTGGSYESDAINITNSFYINKFSTEISSITPNPYSEKHFEASPLNRILEQGAPGTSWKIDKTSDNDHTIKFDYAANTHDSLDPTNALNDNVRWYNVTLNFSDNTYTPTLQNTTTYYEENELYKTITKDENWKPSDGLNKTTEEFKDKQGRVILKRTFNSGDEHDTYYVYDNYGNLTYVLPPKLEPSSASISTIIGQLNELGYQYIYDHRNRLVEKKIPGKDWEFIVYDNLDRPVLTQDGRQRKSNNSINNTNLTVDEWLVTKYDVLGRVVYTGVYRSDSSRPALQTQFNNKNTAEANYEGKVTSGSGYGGIYYTNADFPVIASSNDILTVNYYDNYYFNKDGLSLPSSYEGQTIINYNNSSSTQKLTKGLETGSKVRVLGTTSWITTMIGYDTKGRAIYTTSKNPYLQTTDIVKSKLDYVGKPDKIVTTHAKTGKATITTEDNFDYDHAGRLLSQKQKINTLPDELIVLNKYDELGQLENKKVGGAVATPIENSSGLQTVDYTYNVRGWLKNINQDANSDNDLFNFTLMYDDISDINKKLYNGNISQTIWNTLSNNTTGNPKSTQYTYTYDSLNRITIATDNTNNYSLGSTTNPVTYDKNGNIQSLLRQGHTTIDGNGAVTGFGTMDNLDYNYYPNSNKLQSVQELSGGHATYGFKNGSSASTEYIYDTNGNLTSDLNKGIAANGIEYNHLNMPTKITVSNAGSDNGVIDYVYTADGIKIQKRKTQGGVTITTDYAGNYVYENASLKQFNQAEGYVEPKNASDYSQGFQYVYRYTDIWGNTRITYADDNGNGIIDGVSEIRREQNYYPFGMEHKGYNNAMYGAKNNLKTYQKQEFTEDLGLNTHEWKFRMSDPSIGRFWQIDPLSEDYVYNSTYAFQENKMGMGVELEGLELGHFSPIGGNPLAFLNSAYKNRDKIISKAKSVASDIVKNVKNAINNAELNVSVGKQVGVKAGRIGFEANFGSSDLVTVSSNGTITEGNKNTTTSGFSISYGAGELSTSETVTKTSEDINITYSNGTISSTVPGTKATTTTINEGQATFFGFGASKTKTTTNKQVSQKGFESVPIDNVTNVRGSNTGVFSQGAMARVPKNLVKNTKFSFALGVKVEIQTSLGNK